MYGLKLGFFHKLVSFKKFAVIGFPFSFVKLKLQSISFILSKKSRFFRNNRVAKSLAAFLPFPS